MCSLTSILPSKIQRILSCFSAYIKGLIEQQQKFIIFAHHMVMLNAISDCLQRMNVDFVRIDGSTKHDMRTVSQRWNTERSPHSHQSIVSDACEEIPGKIFVFGCGPIDKSLQLWHHIDCGTIGDFRRTRLES